MPAFRALFLSSPESVSGLALSWQNSPHEQRILIGYCSARKASSRRAQVASRRRCRDEAALGLAGLIEQDDEEATFPLNRGGEINRGRTGSLPDIR
jgi:hypothetical protein